MIYPVTHSIQIIRRSTFDVTFQILINDQLFYDLTNKTILAQLWDRKREEKYADFTVDVINASLGLFKLVLSSSQTINLPQLGTYDVKAIDNVTNNEYYLVKGSFSTQEGYTDD